MTPKTEGTRGSARDRQLRRRRALTLALSLGVGFGLGASLSLSRPAGAAEPASVAPASTIAPEQAEFFEAKVRPVLVEACSGCHGAKKQGGGLRLDGLPALLEGGENGPALVPGDPENSLLVQAVRRTHGEIKMPPKGALPAPEVEALTAWVRMGAPWPSAAAKSVAGSEPAGAAGPAALHWAFRPVLPVTPPTVRDPGWVASPVDAFVLARLEGAGLAPSPSADRRTLIRRLTFDLTGLPPTPVEVAAFEADQTRDAWPALVDRLLASPRYGERWGRHWLDVARYADTKGYLGTEDRRFPYSYTYRDYVIRSFNADKPYDAFLVEQLAADRLAPGGDPGALAGLGFLTVGRRFLNNRDDIIDDRIDVVSRGMLGLTVTCARCHDHKFDPIPTADYYSLYGVFASSVEPDDPPEIPGTLPADQVRDFQAELAARQKGVDDFLAGKRASIQADLRAHAGAYLRASQAVGLDPKGPKVEERARAEKLVLNRLRFVAGHWKRRLDAARSSHDPVLAPWVAFAAIPEAEFAARAAEVARSFPADGPKAVNARLARSFADRPPADMAEVAARYADLLDEAERLGLDAAKTGATALADPGLEAVRQLLYADGGPLVVAAADLGRLLNQTEGNELNQLRTRIGELKATHPGSPPRAMAMVDKPAPEEPHVFLRGNSGRPGDQVPRQFLKVLTGPDRKPFKDGSGRLELARAVADPANPLTARVFVNRVWAHHFGTGLVATPSDFGLRSDPPTHPELLDWLAGDFVRGGWSVKSLHRRILLSSAYRQRSENRPECLAKDPENRLLWKFNRRRLEFEATRDALLAVSGTLDPAVGGHPVALNEPPYPARRTVYGYIDRQNLDGLYRTFDFASPDATSPRRFVTTVPQQALFLMNSPFVIDQAKHLAAAADRQGGDAVARVNFYYQRLYGRDPSPGERDLAVGFVARQLGAGPSLPPPAWTHGFGRVDEPTGRVEGYQPLPHFTGKAWQSGPTLPGPPGNYLHWTATGGHVGPDPGYAAILRWTAPTAAVLKVGGVLKHDNAPGNGVRGRVVSSRSGLLGTWRAHKSQAATTILGVRVEPGETLDFVVDGLADENSDSFSWAPTLLTTDGDARWDSRADFEGPAGPGLNAWEELGQVLLLTNEFVFVD